jgi:hypothetical protein
MADRKKPVELGMGPLCDGTVLKIAVQEGTAPFERRGSTPNQAKPIAPPKPPRGGTGVVKPQVKK